MTTLDWITVPGDGMPITAVRATGRGGGGPLLFIHENRGLVAPMLEAIHRLADDGHDVVAPDLLSRIGGTDAAGTDSTTRAIPEDTHEADLVAVYDWMTSHGPGVPAVIGFCFGGEMGWRLITRRSPDRAALFYGIGPHPEQIPRIRSRVLAVYAQDDDRVNGTLGPVFAAAASAGLDATSMSYPGTRHAFLDTSRPERHHAAAAEHAWSVALDFLRR